MIEEVLTENFCTHLGAICEHEYTDCPLETQPDDCIKLPPGEGEGEIREIDPPGGPG